MRAGTASTTTASKLRAPPTTSSLLRPCGSRPCPTPSPVTDVTLAAAPSTSISSKSEASPTRERKQASPRTTLPSPMAFAFAALVRVIGRLAHGAVRPSSAPPTHTASLASEASPSPAAESSLSSVLSLTFANCFNPPNRLPEYAFFPFFGAPTTDVHHGASSGTPSGICETNKPTSPPTKRTTCRCAFSHNTTPTLLPSGSPSVHRIHPRVTPCARPTTHTARPSDSKPMPTDAKLHASAKLPSKPEP